jgi:hypothetical protein
LSGVVHGFKATTRPVITVSTGGFGNPVISMVEDGVAAITSIMAIIAPIVAIFLLFAFGLLLWWMYQKVRRMTAFVTRSAKSPDATTLR